MRGDPEEVTVDPTTERWGVAAGAGKRIEVMMICGIRKVLWREIMAWVRVSMSTIFTPESHLQFAANN